MPQNKPIIFVSYSLRKSEISKEKLSELRKSMSHLSFYIDIFDNPHRYESEYSENSLPHKHVINKLKESDVIFSVSSWLSSPWVARELGFARRNHIPIIRIKPHQLTAILNKDEKTLASIHYKLLCALQSQEKGSLNQQFQGFDKLLYE